MTINSSESFSSKELKLSEKQAEKLAKSLEEQIRQGKIPSADSTLIDLIIAGLGDKRGLLRRSFAESLASFGKAAVPALQKALLHHSNVTVRRAAAKTLKLIGDPDSLPELLEALLKDPDPVVEGSAAAAIAIFGEKAVEPLLKVLTNPSSTAMQCGLATWGLAFIGSEASQALKKAALSDDQRIRAAAIGALGEQINFLKDKDAKSLLITSLEDPCEEVRNEATKLIGGLDQTNWGTELLLPRLSDKSKEVRKNAALALMKLKATKALPVLIDQETQESDKTILNILRLAIRKIKEEL